MLKKGWLIPPALSKSRLSTSRRLKNRLWISRNPNSKRMSISGPKNNVLPERKGPNSTGTKTILLLRLKLLKSLRNYSKNLTLKSTEKVWKSWKLKGTWLDNKNRPYSTNKEPSSEISLRVGKMEKTLFPSIQVRWGINSVWRTSWENKLDFWMTRRKKLNLSSKSWKSSSRS